MIYEFTTIGQEEYEDYYNYILKDNKIKTISQYTEMQHMRHVYKFTTIGKDEYLEFYSRGFHEKSEPFIRST